ncbi:MAG: TIGR03769 domain-containing protein [Verrucomicrobia bacterium]|nr:choice-of-anchor M domain-containing protein [Kiritimatiellia bacterium]MCB1101739.1 choice-of-anchor M domain-containing protein [Kiritimatiellia bacterium]MCP5488654.1 TIGR03769 domain-containing protein [Verrucomicrobiota bacterium]
MQHLSTFRRLMRATTLTGAILALAAVPAHADIWTSGHGDFGLGYLPSPDFEIEPHWHLEGGIVDGVPQDDVEFEADELIVQVPLSTFDYVTTQGGRAVGAAWDPIGVAAGVSYWFLPQANSGAGGAAALGSPFVGIGSEELDPLDWTGNLTLTLTGMTGPGQFSMWTDGLGPTFYMSTADGISSADSYSVTPGSHSHVNWGFTAPGTYELTFEASGTHNTDGSVSGGPTTFSFNVVPEPGSVALFGLGGLLLMATQRRR